MFFSIFLILLKVILKIKVISSWTQICIIDRFILLRWRTYFNSLSLKSNGSSSVLSITDRDCSAAYISVLLKFVVIFIEANDLGTLFVVSSMTETMRQIVDKDKQMWCQGFLHRNLPAQWGSGRIRRTRRLLMKQKH